MVGQAQAQAGRQPGGHRSGGGGAAARLAPGEAEMRDWDIYRALRSIPLEAVVFGLAGIEPGVVETRLRRYLTDIRHRTLSIKGDDLSGIGNEERTGRGPGPRAA